MLFEFILRPLNKVAPWGNAPDLSLSWFGLTDGDYRINVGSQHLFAYSEGIKRHFSTKDPNFRGDYVNYHVVRLWEDICEILPDVFAPIPMPFAQGLSDSDLSRIGWFKRVHAWWQNLDDAVLDNEEADYRAAIDWLGRRKLDSLYLRSGPRVWFWSSEEKVTVTWDNRGLLIDGVQAWGAQYGSFSMSRFEFMQEVRDFDTRLIAQMAERVQEVRASWSRPEIKIDFEQLQHDHKRRAQYLDETLCRPAHVENWESILHACERLDRKMAVTPHVS